MAGEKTTIARPYAEAVFARAEESSKLDDWSNMLSFLTIVVESKEMAPVVGNPLIEHDDLVSLLLEIAGDKVDQEGGNLIKVLVENNRLNVLPEINASTLRGYTHSRTQSSRPFPADAVGDRFRTDSLWV